MANQLIYWHPSDEDQVVGQPQTTFFAEDQNAEWWIGQFQAGNLVATANANAVALQTDIAYETTSLWQDDPAGFLTATVDEYFWQNPAVTCYWLNVWPQQSAFDEQTPVLFGQYDEDFWQNPTPPVPGILGSLYLPDPEELPAASLTATVDEYFWQNPTPPVPGILGPLYLPDPEEIPAADLTATVDEYFWQNPAVVCYQPLNVPQLWSFEQGDIVQVVSFQPDEDFWQVLVQPVAGTLGSLYLPDPDEIPAASLTATVDEYYWNNPNTPIAASIYIVLPYGPDATFDIVPQPVGGQQNYVSSGAHNYISQEIGGGIKF